MCLRMSRMPLSSPKCAANSWPCRRMMAATSPRVGGVAGVVPVNAAESSANNHGRPRQPRPMTTPSHPVAAIIASASSASKMSPLPSTGTVGDVLLEQGDLLPVGGSRVALRRGAGMQRHGGRALLGGDPARVQVGVMGVVDADAELHGHRYVRALGGAHRRGDDLAEQPPLERQRGAAPAPGDLGHRAAEVHVDVVGHALVGDHFRRGEGGVRVDGVELQRPRRLVRRERRHVHGDRMALDERTRGHHLADVEPADRPGPGQLEFTAQRAECDVRHTGHRGQHDGAPQLDRPDPQCRLLFAQRPPTSPRNGVRLRR